MSAVRPVRQAARPVGVLLLGVLVVGLAIGALWSAVAPRVPIAVRDGGGYLADPEGSQLFAGDGWFFLLTAGAGLVTGAAAYVVLRRRRVAAGYGGVAGVLGVVAGGFLAAVVAWRFGHLLGPGPLAGRVHAAADGATLDAPLNLHAKAALFGWPIAATMVFVALTVGLEQRQQPAPPEHPEPTTPAEPLTSPLPP